MMPKSEGVSRQELREDITELRRVVEAHRVEFRQTVRDELKPLIERQTEFADLQRIANGRTKKLEEWQAIRSFLERAAIWGFGLLISGGVVAWLFEQWR